MRILVLAPQEFYVDRGTPIAVRLLLVALAGQGHEVDLLTYHLGAAVDLPNVTVHRIPRVPFVSHVPPGLSPKKLLCDAVFFAAFVRLLARRRYDVIHAVEESVFMALAARGLLGTPYVYDMDSSMSQQITAKYPALRPLGALMRALEGRAIRHSDAVAPVCDALAAWAGAYRPRRVVMLRDVSLLQEGASEVEGTGEAVRREVGLRAGDGPLVMYVGNLEAYQGIDLLLEAFVLAARRVPGLVLAVVGGTAADVETYRRRASDLSVGARVRFLGPRPVAALSSYLAAADILVSPRIRGENTPMKVYSYLHAGRAVLATDLVTHTQVLDPEVAVLAAPSPEAFGEALVRLATDADLRARLGEAGRRRVTERHSYRVFEAQVAALYGGTPGEPGRQAGSLQAV